jgi:hypothetical protein
VISKGLTEKQQGVRTVKPKGIEKQNWNIKKE